MVGECKLSRTDILSEIKKAEAEADAKVAQAEADKKTVIAEARRDSVKGIQDAEAKARSNYDSVIAKEQATVNIEKGKKLAEGEKESEVLEASSAKKIKKVNDLLIKEFERTINVSS
jgi:V/A-type H+-transporting ATPase subunit G/H